MESETGFFLRSHGVRISQCSCNQVKRIGVDLWDAIKPSSFSQDIETKDGSWEIPAIHQEQEVHQGHGLFSLSAAR